MPAIEADASFLSSFVSLSKTIVGAGLLSMPLAFSTDGLVGGIFIILLAALTSGFGLFLQAYVSKYVPRGHATFFNVCLVTYPALSLVFDLAIATQCFGSAISYLVLIGDLMPTIVTSLPFLDREHYRTFWILASGVLCVPLCFLRNLDSLKYTSVLALGAIGYLCVLIVGHYLLGNVPAELRGETHLLPLSFTNVCSTFSIIVFAFTGHQNMFSIINEAHDKSLLTLSSLVNAAVLCAATLFIGVGLAGYLTFGDLVDGNVVLLYPAAWTTTLGRLCIVFMVVFSFPLMIHPARISFNNIYYWVVVNVFGKHPQSNQEGEQEAASLLPDHDQELQPLPSRAKAYIVPFPDSNFYVITTVLLVVGYTLAATITSFALVLAVVGATGSTAISFILPGLFGYKLIGSESDDPSSIEHIFKWLSFALVLWGFAVMVVCLYSSLAL